MELWTSLPGIVRYSLAGALVVIGLLLFFFTTVRFGFCGLLVGLGFAGLVIGPSNSDKNGYRF